ncbi:MAG: cytochrome-c peroxidase [Bacteroidales bacterium]|nr:cytochrome-c peroxidase [Bacteroidales bacterium]
MRKLTVLITLLALFAWSCSNGDNSDKPKNEENANTENELLTKAKVFFKVLPKTAENPDNKITNEKVKLGKVLYFDKRLSKNQTQSCNTCHNLATYGVDNLSTSPGDNGKPGVRNSPTVYNSALQFRQFWDGREPDVEAQAGGPVLNPAEMAMPDEKIVIDRLLKADMYQQLFKAAFPNEENPVNFDNLKKAIGAFERTLITPTRFDEFLAGKEDALNEQEQKGLKTFMEVGCTTCHIGENLGGTMYQKFGLFGDYAELTKSKTIDNGRYDVSQNEADKFMFKVPILRNIEKTYPYFHDGSVADLNEAVRIMAKLELNKDLSDEQVNDIVTFLKSLTADIPEDWKTEPAELAQK